MKTAKDTTKVTKSTYRVKNWSVYNQSLIQRGSITLWLPDNTPELWYDQGRNTYTDEAIEILLTMKACYNLPLRATIGFMQSIFKLSGLTLTSPCYTTISRRAKKLNIQIKKKKKKSVAILLDSSGLKVHGEGEWKVRKHGWSYRRSWKKIHIGIDNDGEVRLASTTVSGRHDSMPVKKALTQEKSNIHSFYGDGGYDFERVYKTLQKREVDTVLIPPRKDAKIKQHGNCKSPPHPRDENLRAIRKSTRKKWKRDSGYHKRSLVENTMYRFKITFGQHLSFRNGQSQHNEVITKCNILNKFYSLGMPESYLVSV